jgi:hypothetical protein
MAVKRYRPARWLISLLSDKRKGRIFGIQKPNHNFARFEQALRNRKHIFFVDLEPNREAVLEKVLRFHQQVELAGTGSSTPHWLIALQQKSGMIRHS